MAISLRKKLATGTVVGAWNYEDGNCIGQGISVKNNESGIYYGLVYVESVNCAEGLVNRIAIRKSLADQLGFVIVEE